MKKKSAGAIIIGMVGLMLAVPVLESQPLWVNFLLALLVIAALVIPSGARGMTTNGGVNITLENGQLGGTLQTDDGIFGMVLTGFPDGGGYAVGTPVLVTGMADVATAGITVGDNPFAMKQIQEFYNEAGEGAELYIMLVADTQTVADMADNTNANGAKLLLDFAGGKIKVLGIMSDDTAVTVSATTTGINDDVATALSNMAVMAAAYFAAETPFRCIIGGTSYQGATGDLTNMLDGTTNNRVAILIGDTDTTYSNKGAALGLVLGRLATLPVNSKVSKVKIGAMTNQHAWLGSVAFEATGGDATIIAGLGYITWKKFPLLAGYYLSGDDTCSATNNDYHFIARGRTIDKAHRIGYQVFVQEVDDEVQVDETTGLIRATYAKWLEKQIENQLNLGMTNRNEISGAECYIDPAQDILSTNELAVVLKVTPVGNSSQINIQLGFSNPANG